MTHLEHDLKRRLGLDEEAYEALKYSLFEAGLSPEETVTRLIEMARDKQKGATN